jgi:hypothetical protein
MVLSRDVNIILKINIEGSRLVAEEHKRGYESIRGEEERGSKGMLNNSKFPKFPNLHFFIVYLIKDPNH